VSKYRLNIRRIERLKEVIADAQAKLAKAESELEQAKIDDARAVEQGATPNRNDKMKAEAMARRQGIAAKYRGGMSYAEIGKEIGVTRARVAQIVWRAAREGLGLQPMPSYLDLEQWRAEDHKRHALTKRIVAEWRQEHKNKKAAPARGQGQQELDLADDHHMNVFADISIIVQRDLPQRKGRVVYGYLVPEFEGAELRPLPSFMIPAPHRLPKGAKLTVQAVVLPPGKFRLVLQTKPKTFLNSLTSSLNTKRYEA
jgi:hypothetical protein